MKTDANRPRLLTCAILACAGLFGALAPAAGAVVTHSSSGRFFSIAPRSGAPASGAARAPATRAASRASSPSTAHFTTSYESLVNRYFTDVGHDSGLNTNVYGVSAQFGPAPFPASGTYNSSFGGQISDATPYPADGVHGNANGCSPPAAPSSYVWCLTDAQVRNEISSVIASHSLPSDSSAVYFLLLPPGVDECQDAAGTVCANNVFCAYHSSFGPGNAAHAPAYAVIPYGDVSGCQTGESPNGDPADDTISLISHEHNEAITDPFGTGWFDSDGNEIADKCIATFGATLGGGSGAGFNQTINGDHYYLQDEFSNNNQDTCEQRPAGNPDGVGPGQHPTPLSLHGSAGSVLGAHSTYAIYWDPTTEASPPAASLVGPSAANAGQTVTFDASGSSDPQGGGLSYSWDFGDGTSGSGPVINHIFTVPGPHTVTVSVTDGFAYSSSASQSITINAAPTPSFVTPAAAFAPGQAVPFDASASSDADGFITSYVWNFGDGNGGSGVKTSHAYSAPGNYTVSLTVTDNSGNTAFVSAPVFIQVGANGGGISGPGTGPGGSGSFPPGSGLAQIASIGSPHTLTLDRGVTVVTGQAIRCPVTTAHCTITITMTTRSGTAVAASHGHRRVAAHTVTIGNARFTTPGGGSSALAIRLNQRGLQLLTKQRHLRANVTLVSSIAGGRGIRSTESFTLNAPRDLGRRPKAPKKKPVVSTPVTGKTG